jgi:signal transduction histidine kinase
MKAFMPLHNNTSQEKDIFRNMFDELPMAIALCGFDGRIVYTNKEFQTVSGKCDNAEDPHHIHDLIRGVSTSGKEFTDLLKDKSPGARYEVNDARLIKANKQVPINLLVTRIGDLYCFTITTVISVSQWQKDQLISDIQVLKKTNTSLLEQNEALQQSNNELSRSNQELAQYAYVASHDLQEPLRKIRIFSDLLISSLQHAPKERFLVNKINKASERMSYLIRDLLNYSKLLKPDGNLEKVNLQEIFNAVLNDFEVSIQEKKAVISAGELPVIDAVKLQMNQLFYNLLGNALKFTRPGEPPRIEVSAEDIGHDELPKILKKSNPQIQYARITFRDQGIGFDNSEADQIFEVFRRLHTRETYQGSGIGLALCRRIVQNHSGHLFAASQPGQGSTFTIIIPKG